MIGVEERPPAPRVAAQPSSLGSLVWEVRWQLYYGVLVATALALRLWDLGSRALHHDESLHAFFSWNLYMGRGYVHDPMMHGPLLFELNALIYFLFGDSDFTARLVPALLGTALCLLPFWLRHELGRLGAAAAALFLALSPSFLYFSRFIRHDIHIAFWNLLIAVAVFGYLRTRAPRYVYLGAAAAALSYATKEDVYITGFVFLTFFVAAIVVQRWRSGRSEVLEALQEITPRQWAICVGIFLAIYAVLFTTFFTNINGLYTGSIGDIQYWLTQQGVRRGGQPWFYYLMLVPLYEFLPLIFALAAVVRLWRRGGLLFWFSMYWSVAALAIYSWAGEKMPWLVLPIALPLILLAGQFWEDVLRGQGYRVLLTRQALLRVALALLLLASLVSWLALGAAAALTPLLAQEVALRRLASLAVVAGAAGALAHTAARDGLASLRWPAGGTLSLVLLGLSIHTAWNVTYVNGDIPVDMLVYVQTSPDVPWVVRQIRDISYQTGQRDKMDILLDGGYSEVVGGQTEQHEGIAWPFEWYLRHYTKKRYFSKTLPPDVNLAQVPVILVMAPNLDPIRSALKDYSGQVYKLNWWYPEDYKTLTWSKVVSGLADPTVRAKLLRYLLYRKTLNPLGAREFYFFVRKDIPRVGPAALPPAAPVAREATAQPGPGDATIYGRAPSGQSVLDEPKSIAVDNAGRLYVVESKADRVTVFSPDGSVLRSWGSPGDQDGQFNEPWGIAVSPDGEVYVADTWNHRIQRFDASGKFLGSWGGFANTGGQADQAPGLFWGPRAIAITSDSNVLVADTGNKRIQVFDRQGRFVTAFGGGGDGPGQLEEPVGIALGKAGNIYVADTWNQRIDKFSPQYKFEASFPVQGWASQSVVNKPYLAVDPRGTVFATAPDTASLLELATDGRVGPAPVDLSLLGMRLPIGVAVGQDGSIYVSDSASGIVARFPPQGGR